MKAHLVLLFGISFWICSDWADGQGILVSDNFSYSSVGDFRGTWTYSAGGGIYFQTGQMSVRLANTMASRNFGTLQPIGSRQPWNLGCSIGQTAFERGQWFALLTSDRCHGYLARWDSSILVFNGGCGSFSIYKYDSTLPLNTWNIDGAILLGTKNSLHPVLPTMQVSMQLMSTWDTSTNKRKLTLTVPNLIGSPSILQVEVADEDQRLYTQIALGGNSSGVFSSLCLSTYSQVFNVASYGATGNGVTDDTASLANAFAAAKAVGGGVYIPSTPYSYNYSACLNVDGISVWGDGPSSLLRAMNPYSSALIVSGDYATLSNVKITSPFSSTIGRQISPNTSGVVINGATNFSLYGIMIDTTASVGIISLGGRGSSSRHSQISACTISNTLADGIHLTQQSAYINLINNTVSNPGDDMFAVVSYTRDSGLCHDIQISGNTGSGQSANGRGISVVGGSNVSVLNNVIQNTRGAGVYLSSELVRNPDGSLLYKTFGDDSITVQGNLLTNLANTIYHGGINIGGRPADLTDAGQLESQDQLITNVTVFNNSVINAHHSGISLQGYFNGISIDGNTITSSAEKGIEVFGGSNLFVGDQLGNAINKSGNFGMYVGTNAAIPNMTDQSLVIINNTFADSNIFGTSLLPVIYLTKQTVGLSMNNNQFSNSSNYLMAIPYVQFQSP